MKMLDASAAEFWARNHASDSQNLWSVFGTQLQFKDMLREIGIEHVDFRDIKEVTRHFPKAMQPQQPRGTNHHSLHDARHERAVWQELAPRVRVITNLAK